jgi:tetratricopeptide (TPR) repeat protein
MNSLDTKLAILLQNRLWEHLDSFSAEALAAGPHSSIALAAKGLSLLKNDDTVGARSLFLDALRAEPTDPLPRCGLYLCDYRNGDFAQASQRLLDLLKDFPENESLHVTRCLLYTKFRKRQLAEEAFSSALQRFPENEELLSAQLYHARRYPAYRDVQALGTSLLRLYPNNLVAHLTLGEQCLMQGKLDQAEEHFRTCVTIAPSESTVRMMKIVEARRTGKGLLALLLWTIKRKLLKLFVPGYAKRERLNLKWSR